MCRRGGMLCLALGLQRKLYQTPPAFLSDPWKCVESASQRQGAGERLMVLVPGVHALFCPEQQSLQCSDT